MIKKTSKMIMAFTAILLALTACSHLNNRDPTSGATNSGESNNAAQPQSSYLKRDVREDVFYFVMPDRFNNGDVSNDGAPKGSLTVSTQRLNGRFMVATWRASNKSWIT